MGMIVVYGSVTLICNLIADLVYGCEPIHACAMTKVSAAIVRSLGRDDHRSTHCALWR